MHKKLNKSFQFNSIEPSNLYINYRMRFFCKFFKTNKYSSSGFITHQIKRWRRKLIKKYKFLKIF